MPVTGTLLAPDLPAATPGWVEQQLGARLRLHVDPLGLGPAGLVALALRRNPRRAQLLVSRVLAKHVPVAGAVAVEAGARLAVRVAVALGAGPPPLVIGFAETATGLGHLVADGLAGSTYLHSTRHPAGEVAAALAFEEEHSHATAHRLLPAGPARRALCDGRPVVLVDDELSTGRTAINTVTALEQVRPGGRYLLAVLVDVRPTQAREAVAARAAELGVELEVVSLQTGSVHVPAGLGTAAGKVAAGLAAPGPRPVGGPAPQTVVAPWPAGLPTGGRHGWLPADRDLLPDAVTALAHAVSPRLLGRRTLVLGTEELIAVPVRLAAALGAGTLVQSTTRSPVLAIDEPGYPVQMACAFPALDDPQRTSFVYNLRPGCYDDVLLVTEGTPDPGALAATCAELGDCSGVPVTVLALP